MKVVWVSLVLLGNILGGALMAQAGEPIAANQRVETGKGLPLIIDLSIENADNGAELEFLADPAHGDIPTYTGIEVTYRPEPGFCGKDSFEYRVTTEAGSDDAKVEVVVCPSNNAPTLSFSQPAAVVEDNEVEVEFALADANGDDTTLSLKTAPSHGEVEIPDDGKPTDGKVSVRYVPSANFVGSDSFTVIAQEVDSSLSSEPAEVKVEVKDKDSDDSSQTPIKGVYNPDEVTIRALCSLDGCDPGALSVSAAKRSTIRFRLPEGASKIAATAGESWNQDGLNSDSIDFGDRQCTETLINVHRRRKLFSSYGAWGSLENASARFEDDSVRSEEDPLGIGQRGRQVVADPADPCEDTLNILVSNRATVLQVHVTNGSGTTTQTVSLDLLQRPWSFEAGAFYSLHRASDEVLVVENVPASPDGEIPAMRRVLALREGGSTNDTGLMFTFFPSNYPVLGMGFGIAESEGRGPAYFLGGAVRLLGKKSAAVVSLHAGYVSRPVRTYPGLTAESSYIETNPLLDGELSRTSEPYIALEVGFSLSGQSSQE